jgi:hypothetical protein
MRSAVPFHSVFVLVAAALAACVSSDDTTWREIQKRYVVTYYDRNHDGRVDFELHHLPGGADTDWALSDTKFRGRYDLRIDWGYAYTTKRIDAPIPTGVKITPGKPPGSDTQ